MMQIIKMNLELRVLYKERRSKPRKERKLNTYWGSLNRKLCAKNHESFVHNDAYMRRVVET